MVQDRMARAKEQDAAREYAAPEKNQQEAEVDEEKDWAVVRVRAADKAVDKAVVRVRDAARAADKVVETKSK